MVPIFFKRKATWIRTLHSMWRYRIRYCNGCSVATVRDYISYATMMWMLMWKDNHTIAAQQWWCRCAVCNRVSCCSILALFDVWLDSSILNKGILLQLSYRPMAHIAYHKSLWLYGQQIAKHSEHRKKEFSKNTNFEQMVWFIRSTNLCIPFFVLVFFEGLKGPTTNIYGAHFL